MQYIITEMNPRVNLMITDRQNAVQVQNQMLSCPVVEL